MIVLAYALYLAIAIGLTIWVAHTLSTNGEVFLIECFGHDETLAKSTNHLLVVGFYLVNLGFILLALQFGREPHTLPEMIRFLSSKVGLAVVVLGFMHFFNMNAIAKFGRKVSRWLREGQDEQQPTYAQPGR
jgi:drug/metabolite transporter (DMT)-like permease